MMDITKISFDGEVALVTFVTGAFFSASEVTRSFVKSGKIWKYKVTDKNAPAWISIAIENERCKT